MLLHKRCGELIGELIQMSNEEIYPVGIYRSTVDYELRVTYSDGTTEHESDVPRTDLYACYRANGERHFDSGTDWFVKVTADDRKQKNDGMQSGGDGAPMSGENDKQDNSEQNGEGDGQEGDDDDQSGETGAPGDDGDDSESGDGSGDDQGDADDGDGDDSEQEGDDEVSDPDYDQRPGPVQGRGTADD